MDSQQPAKKRILVDMDGTIADFNGQIAKMWSQRYPHLPPPAREGMFSWKPDEVYESIYPGMGKFVRDIYQGSGFFDSITPIDGSQQALKEMLEAGHDVFLCTSPVGKYDYCVHDKYKWTDIHLGKEWTKRIILTPDKTFVSADYIIDDKPNITGIQNPPLWKQIIFDQPYNRDVCKPRITKWSEWRDVINAL